MKVNLAYGQGHLPVELPEDCTTVILPAHQKELSDERAAVLEALDHPIGTNALRELVEPSARVCITFTDITRATPNHRLIPSPARPKARSRFLQTPPLKSGRRCDDARRRP